MRNGILQLVADFMDFQMSMKNPPEVPFHPFTGYFTLSSFSHALFRYFSVKPDEIYLTTNQSNSRRTSSLELEWLAWQELQLGRPLQTAFSSPEGQHKIAGCVHKNSINFFLHTSYYFSSLQDVPGWLGRCGGKRI